MIVVMKPGASPEQIQHMIERVEETGMEARPIYGTNRTVIACVGDKRGVDLSALETGVGVEKLVPILAPYKMASREVKPETSVVPVGPSPSGVGPSNPGPHHTVSRAWGRRAWSIWWQPARRPGWPWSPRP